MTTLPPMPAARAIASREGQSRRAARFLRAASAIGDQLGERAVRCRDGSRTWLAPAEPASGKTPRPTPLGPHLYEGTAGVGLFLAALHHVTGEPGYRELALHAVAPLRHKLAGLLAEPGPQRVKLGIGGLVGLGSHIYALVRIGGLLGEPALAEEAHRLTDLLDPERIAGEERVDVVLGSAGALLALLALAPAASGPNRAGLTPLDLAAACARHLLARRLSAEGPRGWPPSPGNPPLTGFAHGAAGICYALLQLYRRSGDPALWQAAQEGLAFERSAYSPEHRNWLDLRRPERRFMTAWCHGAPGVALGRLGILDITDDDAVRAEIEAGLATTESLGCVEVDHLCCGNMGRVEILAYAHQKLGSDSAREGARALAEQVLARAEGRGCFALVPPPEEVFDPSLFRGVAGIGYALLRLARPELPCCLLLE